MRLSRIRLPRSPAPSLDPPPPSPPPQSRRLRWVLPPCSMHRHPALRSPHSFRGVACAHGPASVTGLHQSAAQSQESEHGLILLQGAEPTDCGMLGVRMESNDAGGNECERRQHVLPAAERVTHDVHPAMTGFQRARRPWPKPKRREQTSC